MAWGLEDGLESSWPGGVLRPTPRGLANGPGGPSLMLISQEQVPAGGGGVCPPRWDVYTGLSTGCPPHAHVPWEPQMPLRLTGSSLT